MGRLHGLGHQAMRRRPWRTGGRLLALAVAAALWGACRSSPAATPPRRAVRVVEVAPRDAPIASRHAGSLEPHRRIDVNFKVSGRVRELLQVSAGEGPRSVHEGDRVRSGEVLATLDDADLALELRSAASALDAARAQERSAVAALAQAHTEARRSRYLFEGATIPRAQLDKAETTLSTARDALRAARAAARGKAEQLGLARNAVSYARLRAPIDGVVARRDVDVGELASPSKPAFTILDVSAMKTVFGVSDVRVRDFRDGQRVPVEIDAFPGRVLAGTVTKVSPVPDPALRSYAVEVAIPNEDGTLRSGMVATASVAPGAAAPEILVPLAAVARGPGGDGLVAFVVSRDGVASARPVEIGDLRDNDVQVTKGLSPGERVVVEGAQLLHDGEAVEVVP